MMHHCLVDETLPLPIGMDAHMASPNHPHIHTQLHARRPDHHLIAEQILHNDTDHASNDDGLLCWVAMTGW
jgi:hypothetical protein